MSNKMLIDASHPEETRVVVVRGNKIEEFDFESEHKKQLKGNVYLARVTRVEPSLQAAFIEYGGNRHGFLAFSEIHPDYYQISAAERQALVEAEARAQRDDDDDEQEEAPRRNSNNNSRRNNNSDRRRGSGRNSAPAATIAAPVADTVPPVEFVGDFAQASQRLYEDARKKAVAALASLNEQAVIREKAALNDQDSDDDHDDHDDEDDQVESIGAEDALEEMPVNNRPHRKHYKIQDVIKRRQILLVQVVKEERGNKGAALTTYLSLAGRYSVLMPNTARGGGISRKITNVQDRKRLKEIVKELEVPQGMGVILRTAGANRTKAEVRRDYEYLMRMWDNVRTLTMQSSAPALVYEEGNLIKRTIRDLYNKDITELVVAGEAGYREAKDFMRMLMPSHAKVVQPYRDSTPIFARNGIEAQLDRMLHPQVTLKSGGYIIINQTEALVAVDVNSGRSTRESSIEDTALQTNLEAAEEVARQLRLRDLAGLVVVDFIDMEEKRNNRAVEKRMKDCLKDDRARIQVGRISHFGLLEMSRQRIRASVLESTMQPCPHCAGTGMIRSDSSMALFVIRSIEEYLQRHNQNNIIVRMPAATALYVLNQKRHLLAEMEARFGLLIEIQIDEGVGHQHLAIDKGAPATGPIIPVQHTIQFMPSDEADDLDIIEDEEEDEEEIETNEAESENESDATSSAEDDASDENNRKRRRRRRRRGGRDRDASDSHDNDDHEAQDGDAEHSGSDSANDNSADDAGLSEEDRRKKRRRGRRGGRKNRRNDYENGARVPSVEFVGYNRDEAYARLADYEAANAPAPQAAVNQPASDAQAPEFVGYTPEKAVAAEQVAVTAVSDKAEAKATDQKKSARKRPLRTRNSKQTTVDAETVEATETADTAVISVSEVSTTDVAAETVLATAPVAVASDTIVQAVDSEQPEAETAKPARKRATATKTEKTEKPVRAPRKPRAKKGDEAVIAEETVAAVIAAPAEAKTEVAVSDTPVPAPALAPASTTVVASAEKPADVVISEQKPAEQPVPTAQPAKPVITSQGTPGEKKAETEASGQPKRGGWWQKKGFF